MAQLRENDFKLLILKFPSGVRDFIFYIAGNGCEQFEIINPMELLGLDLAAKLIKLYDQSRPGMSCTLALVRLLIPCLEYRGNRRHLIVEEWSELDLEGKTLVEDTRTVLSRELSVEQATEFRMVRSGEKPPDGSLAEIFWEAHTELPDLTDTFVDPKMSHFVKALYFDLVPPGQGDFEVSVSEFRMQIRDHWSDEFSTLDIPVPNRERRKVFKRLLAATVRLGSQLNGHVAKALIFKRLDYHEKSRDRETLSSEEEALLEFRYGASRALRDINLGLINGCGPFFLELVNGYAQTFVQHADASEREERSEDLRKHIYLLGRFRERRKLARSNERREIRQRYAKKLPGGPTKTTKNQTDKSTERPEERAEFHEDLQILENCLTQLKPRDRERLQAYIDARGDHKKTADLLGVEKETVQRQLRQTVFPNVKKAIRKIALESEW